MDDYARTLYMIALREIQDGGEFAPFVCNELCYVLSIVEGAFGDTFESDDVDIFHHFKSLFDGRKWYIDNSKYTCYLDSGWWEDGWKEPRIRALECLLRD